MTKTANTIKVGQTLTARSIGDSDCIFRAEILARKGQFVTVKAQNEVKRVKIHRDDFGEFIFALGRYSMAPTFRALPDDYAGKPEDFNPWKCMECWPKICRCDY